MAARVQDLSAVLNDRDFRIYQSGNATSTVGFWMWRIAVGWVVWESTHSEALLGLAAFAELAPSVLTGFIGGSLADRGSTTRIMFLGHVAVAAVSFLMALLGFAGFLTIPVIFVMLIIVGAVSGLVLPSRLAMASFLSPPALLPSALAVNSTIFNLSRFLGPAIAGGLLILAPAALVFLIAGLTYSHFAWSLWRIRHAPGHAPKPVNTVGPKGISAVLIGLIALPLIFGVMLLQLAQGVLMRPASELFPAFATVVFDMGTLGLGLLNAALGAGAIIGALVFSRTRDTRSAMAQIFGGSLVFVVTLAIFAVTGNFALALLVLVVQGAAMSSSNIAALAYVQLETPRERLGRVLSIYAIIFRTGPAIGAFFFGFLAEAVGLMPTTLAFAGAGGVATATIWLTMHRRQIRQCRT